MNVHVIPTKKFKTTVACLLLRQPLDRETATITAIIPNILARGSEKYPRVSRMNKVLENMYGSVFESQIIKKSEEQIIQLYIEFISGDDLRTKALEFLKEVLLFPLTESGGFKRKYVDSEKSSLSLAIESRINNKGEYAKLRALEEMCKGERFGIYGDGYLEDIDGLTPQNIYDRYRSVLSNSQAELIIMGDVGDGEHQAREMFRLENCAELPVPDTGFTEREPQRISEQCNITQGKICMGYRTGAANIGPEAYGLMLMSEVLGGNAASKLFMNVREKENLCYYINSFVYRAKSIVFVQSGVDSRNFDRTEELVSRQIEEIAKGNISEAEISGAKKSLLKRFESMRDSQGACIDFYMYGRLLKDADNYDQVLGHIQKLGREDVMEMAQKMRLDTVFRLEAGEGNG